MPEENHLETKSKPGLIRIGNYSIGEDVFSEDWDGENEIGLKDKFCYYSAGLITGTYNLGRGLVTLVTHPIMSLGSII